MIIIITIIMQIIMIMKVILICERARLLSTAWETAVVDRPLAATVI